MSTEGAPHSPADSVVDPGPGSSRGWLWFYLALYLIAATALMGSIHPLRGGDGGLGAMFSGVLAGHDTVTHDYPAAWWGWSQIRTTGQIPLWNPSWFCGVPFIASQTFMPFYPPNWLGALLPWPLAFNIQYPLHLILAAALMMWTCRRRGMTWFAAGFAGLAWGFGGHLATLVGPGHIQKLQALAWLPLVVWGSGRLARGDARRGVWATGIGLALQITAGHLQIVYLTVLASLAEVAVVWISLFSKSKSKSKSNPSSFSTSLSPAAHTSPKSHSSHLFPVIPRSLSAAALAGILALALSAVFLIPTLEFAEQSNRQGKFSFEEAARSSLNPEEAFEFILPRLRGDSMPAGRGAYIPGGDGSTASQERLVSDYVGAGVLFFALWGLIAGGAKRWHGHPARENLSAENDSADPPNQSSPASDPDSCSHGVRGRVALYLLLATLGLLMSLGKYLPGFYRILYDFLPGIGHFRSPWTFAALLAYGMIMAAAWGMDSFLKNADRFHMKPSPWSLLIPGLPAIYFCLAMFNKKIWLHYDPDALEKLSRVASADIMIDPYVHVCSAVFIIAILTLALCLVSQRSKDGRGVFRLIFAVLALVMMYDLNTNARPFWNAEPEAGLRQFLTRWPGFEQVWQNAPQPVRFIEPGNELSNRALTLSDYEHGRLISSAHGYHPVAYGVYFDRLERSSGFTDPALMRDFAMNWLILPPGVEPPEGFRPVASDGRKILHYNGSNPFVSPLPDASTIKAPVVNALAPGEYGLGLEFSLVSEYLIRIHPVPGWRAKADSIQLDLEVVESLDPYGIRLQTKSNRNLSAWINLYWDPISQRLGLYITCLALAVLGFFLGSKSRTFPRRT